MGETRAAVGFASTDVLQVTDCKLLVRELSRFPITWQGLAVFLDIGQVHGVHKASMLEGRPLKTY